MEGGMITAMVADEEVTAAAKGPGYPLCFIAGIKIEPRAATSATAEPDISAKNMEAAILTIASPPRIKPISAEANAISLREIPPVFIMAPAKINNGMARRGNFVAPSNITSATFGSAVHGTREVHDPVLYPDAHLSGIDA